MNQRIILYERVQEEYDQFLQELLQLDEEAIAYRLHELILKTMILDLIVEEISTRRKISFTDHIYPTTSLYIEFYGIFCYNLFIG